MVAQAKDKLGNAVNVGKLIGARTRHGFPWVYKSDIFYINQYRNSEKMRGL
jgi:hypothetical protein